MARAGGKHSWSVTDSPTQRATGQQFEKLFSLQPSNHARAVLARWAPGDVVKAAAGSTATGEKRHQP